MSGLPSDEALLAYLAENPGRQGKRELTRAFGIKGADRIGFKQQLKALKDRGLISKDGAAYTPADQLPAVFPAQIVSVDDDGDLIVVPRLQMDGSSSDRHFILHEKRAGRSRKRTAAPASVGVGDTVLVRLKHQADEPELGAVELIKALGRGDARRFGVIRRRADGSYELEPVDRKASALIIDKHDLDGAEDGDLVAAVKRPGRTRRGGEAGTVVEIFGALGTERAISQIAILRNALPDTFPDVVLSYVEGLALERQGTREDWRHLPLITIDPADAKDHDDAVFAAPDEDPANDGGFVVYVAIADVAAYVLPDTVLDRDARSRGNSVYFPDRVVPMLPERLSTDLCSLHAGEDRPALAIRMTFNAQGEKKRHSLHRVWITLQAGLAYEAAQAAMDGVDPPDGITPCPPALVENVLHPLWRAYRALRTARDNRSPLKLELPERKLRLGPDGTVLRVETPERLEAHQLIEEFMIQANVAAAELLEAKKTHGLYRVHAAPGQAKYEGLRDFLQAMNIKLAPSSSVRPNDFNRILDRVEGKPNQQLVNEMVLRSQAQAEYTPDNIGHFGLNLARYAHFTSPIRRYADLIVHRALIAAYNLGVDGHVTPVDALIRLGDHLSGIERRAMLAERETTDRLVAMFLSNKVGAQFDGRITGVVGAGLFVRLDDTGADGFVPAANLGADYFVYDEVSQRLVGSATGQTFQLGDQVKVKLVEAAPIAGALRFDMMSTGKTGKPIGRQRSRSKMRASKSRSSKASRAENPAAHARRAVRKARGR